MVGAALSYFFALENNRHALEKMQEVGSLQLLVLTVPRVPTVGVNSTTHINEDELQMFTNTVDIFVTASKRIIEADRHMHPCYDLDVLIHELTHAVRYYCGVSFRMPSTVNTPELEAQYEGTEEAFCDYFAVASVGQMKGNILGDGTHPFTKHIGNVHAYYCRDLAYKVLDDKNKEFKKHREVHAIETCESAGEGNVYAKRNYSISLPTSRKWREDEHHYGKGLCKSLIEFRCLFEEPARVRFDDFLWRFYLDLTSVHVVDCVVQLMKALAVAYDTPSASFLPDRFTDVEDMLTQLKNVSYFRDGDVRNVGGTWSRKMPR